ncbi:MAG TPA: hypothetical protein VK866_09870 [Acidimicrobiales bacterium]|nr:hypothetical protein [Acidimicrobiales bacterium]
MRRHLRRLEARVAAELTARGRPHGEVGAAALAGRAAAGASAPTWAARLGIGDRRLEALEGGWLHPALAPVRLLELAPGTPWLDLARAAGDPAAPRGPATLGAALDPLGAARSRHPAARRPGWVSDPRAS